MRWAFAHMGVTCSPVQRSSDDTMTICQIDFAVFEQMLNENGERLGFPFAFRLLYPYFALAFAVALAIRPRSALIFAALPRNLRR